MLKADKVNEEEKKGNSRCFSLWKMELTVKFIFVKKIIDACILFA